MRAPGTDLTPNTTTAHIEATCPVRPSPVCSIVAVMGEREKSSRLMRFVVMGIVALVLLALILLFILI